MDQSLSYYISIAIAILSPVAVVGNALVLAAIWRNTSLRTPCYILLAGLAFSDFSTGLITQPVHVSIDFFHLTDAQLKLMTAIANGCTMFFASNTLLILTLMSLERWLQMIQRRSSLTVRRASIIVVVQLFITTPGTVFRVLYVFKLGTNGLTANMFAVSILLFCFFVTSVSYIKVFRIIRRHQHQIETNDSAHNFGQPAINFAKYKKSVFSILYILAVFYLSYLPICISLVLHKIVNHQNFPSRIFDVSMLFLFCSSSLNPLLYLWRMKQIRNEVTRLIKQILKKE